MGSERDPTQKQFNGSCLRVISTMEREGQKVCDNFVCEQPNYELRNNLEN